LLLEQVIFWTEISYWWKTYSHKATVLLGWSHGYKILRSSSQTDWSLRNISNVNVSFLFYVDLFLPLSSRILLLNLTKSNRTGLYYKGRELHTHPEYLGHPWFSFGGVGVANILLVYFVCCLRSASSSQCYPCFSVLIIDCPYALGSINCFK